MSQERVVRKPPLPLPPPTSITPTPNPPPPPPSPPIGQQTTAWNDKESGSPSFPAKRFHPSFTVLGVIAKCRSRRNKKSLMAFGRSRVFHARYVQGRETGGGIWLEWIWYWTCGNLSGEGVSGEAIWRALYILMHQASISSWSRCS